VASGPTDWRDRREKREPASSACGKGGFLLFWKPDPGKDYHRFALPNILRDMDRHPDGLRVATAHFDGNVHITWFDAKMV
jgi:hypothetical protein